MLLGDPRRLAKRTPLTFALQWNMKLIPYDSFEIVSGLSASDIVAVLNDNIEPTKWVRFSRDHKVFQGSLTRDGFVVTRIIHYRNSFLPIIRGTFKSDPSGVAIAIKMRLHHFVTAFMCVWFGGVGIGIIAMATAFIADARARHPAMLVPLAMLVFGWALVTGGFWVEAKKSKPILLDIFKGRIRSEQSGGAYFDPAAGSKSAHP